jgi:peptidoglycan/xylan/chitin deacetylase (PgdA/CDA1 family)
MRLAKATSIDPVRSTCIRVAASALFYSGALNLLRPQGYSGIGGGQKQKTFGYPFAVLLYHRINPDNDPFFPAVSVQAFDAQMRHLAEHYHVLPLAEIIERMRRGEGVGPGTIAVTFDDGYRDNFVYAHPILRRYDLPATLFVATSYIGTNRQMWNDRIASAVKHTHEHRVSSPGVARTFELVSVAEKLGALGQILAQLKTLPEQEKQQFVDAFCRRLDRPGAKVDTLMLSWAELKEMSIKGWEVGAHTANHVILTRVTFDQAKDEIASSSAVLQQELGRPVRLFAYPNGKPDDYDLSIKKVLDDAGYIGAVTTVDRLNDRNTDPFAIGRKSPWEESLPGFALKLKWTYWRQQSLPPASVEQTAESLP